MHNESVGLRTQVRGFTGLRFMNKGSSPSEQGWEPVSPLLHGSLTFHYRKKKWFNQGCNYFFNKHKKGKNLLITLGETKVTPASRVNNVIHVSVGVHGARKVSPCPAQVNLKPLPINPAIQKWESCVHAGFISLLGREWTKGICNLQKMATLPNLPTTNPIFINVLLLTNLKTIFYHSNVRLKMY